MAKTAKKKSKGSAKDRDLPGMEDRAIGPLQDAAHEYASIRDERIKLNMREVELKKKVRDLMHKNKLQRYEYHDVLIELEPPDGEEKVKVKIKKPIEQEEDEE